MRFSAFDQPVDESKWFDFPHKEGVRFLIRRAGYPPYRRRSGTGQQKEMYRAIQAELKKQGLTFDQMQKEGSSGETFQKIASNIEVGDLDLTIILGEPDLEGVAVQLVEKVEGPLILADDSDDELDWHGKEKGTPHLGHAFIQAYPFVVPWVLEGANEVEAQFQAILEGSVKNSPTTSEPATEEVASLS